MKRYGRLWEKIATEQNVKLAIKRVIRLIEMADGSLQFSGRRIPTQAEYEVYEHLDEMMQRVLKELQTRNYDFGDVHEFEFKEGPKLRQIRYLDKHGAILLQCVMNVLQPLFIEKYIKTTYSSIKGRGLTDCVEYIQRYVQNHPDCYFVQVDAKHCYENVDHQIMHDVLTETFKDKYVIEFFDRMMALIDQGLAIGFSPNHYLVNLLFSHMDHRMIEKENFEFFVRYMDDSLVIGTKEECKRALQVMQEEYSAVGQTIKPNMKLAPVTCGIDYGGYVFYPTHTRLRKRIKLNFRKRDRELRASGVSDEEYKLQMASYRGWCKWADCRHLEHVVFNDKEELLKKKKKAMEAKRLSDFRNKKWFGMDHDRFISTNIYNDKRLYENEFTVLEIEEHTFDNKPGIVAHLQINGEDFYTITKSTSLVPRFKRAWESVGSEPFIARLKMQQSQSDQNHKYPILV